MAVTLLLFILLSRAAIAFQSSASHRLHLGLGRRSLRTSYKLASVSDAEDGDAKSVGVTVKATDLDDSLGLSPEERTVVNVHRVAASSVVYVTSVLKSSTSRGGGSALRSKGRRRRRGKEKAPEQDEGGSGEGQQKLPRGTALGSGSGFVVDSDGYIVTNYHVIQRAYESNQALLRYEQFWDGLASNATKILEDTMTPLGGKSQMMGDLGNIINGTINSLSQRGYATGSSSGDLPAQVFVRFGTNGDGDSTSQSSNGASYYPCEIIDVVKELDVAVLRMNHPLVSLRALVYGASSDLLVGQSLLAIGNPFGLDRTLSSGLVSALGRSVKGVAGNDIKNCIQTDAAINPGVSTWHGYNY